MKNYLYQLGLVFITVLCLLSIIGAFLGAEKAQTLFNSLPLAVYWFCFVILLVGGVLAFVNLRIKPALFLMHLGCILVLTGGMWGSHAATKLLRAQNDDQDRIDKGYIKLYPGDKTNQVYGDKDYKPVKLDFELGLNDFQILYYDKNVPSLVIRSNLGSWEIPAVKNTEYILSEQAGKVRILDAFSNLKIEMQNGKPAASEGPAVASNPAWLLEFVAADGQVTQQFAFEHQDGVMMPGYRYRVSVKRTGMVKDYISDLTVLKNDIIIVEKKIEVNHPLYYGGYHIYQDSYGQDENGKFSVLQVVSDRGLYAVFGGYGALTLGLFWHFGLKITKHRKADPACMSNTP